MAKLHVLYALAVLVSGCAFAQDPTPSSFFPNQELRVSHLPSLAATAPNRGAAFAAALETVVNDKGVCCERDSALEDIVEYAAVASSVSLKELSNKLQGKHHLSDGRAISVSVDYVAHAAITPYTIIEPLRAQHAQLVEWNSHIYVMYGVLFDETRFYSGERSYAVHKLFLIDPRFSDARREVVFNRDTDDWDKVVGMSTITVATQ